MSLSFVGIPFDGPFTNLGDVDDQAGVYVVVAVDSNQYRLIDCGEAADLHERLKTHDRKECWQRNANGSRLAVGVHYTADSRGKDSFARMYVEQLIRDAIKLPCGCR